MQEDPGVTERIAGTSAGTGAGSGSAAWLLPAVRAVPVLALAALITFSADHSARLGLVAFACWAVVDAVVTLLAVRRAAVGRPTDAPAAVRRLVALRSGWGLLAGIAAALLAAVAPAAVALQAVVIAWALVAGGLEIAAGLGARRAVPGAGDRLFQGALAVLLAVVTAVVPVEFRADFSGVEGNTGVLTAAIVQVGLLGAWAAVSGLFLVIGAVSLRRPAAGRSA